MISNCGHDENGKYHGGKASDQTRTEYAVINWYSRPWACVLRYPDKKVAEMIAEISEQAAKNERIGYDQYQRLTYYNCLKEVGWYNLSKGSGVVDTYKMGWNKDKNGWWYADTKTSYYKSCWQIINGHKYYFNPDGYSVKDWQEIDDKWYYFEPRAEPDLECALYKSDAVGVQTPAEF